MRVNVLFVTQYGQRAASSRTRVFQYLPFLVSKGIQADVEVVISDALVARIGSGGRLAAAIYYLRCFWRGLAVGWHCVRAVRQYDVLFIQKVLFSFPLPQMLRKRHRNVIFDFDDAVFTTEAPGEGWLAWLRTFRHRRGLPQMLRSSQHALVENAYTAAYTKRYCTRYSILTGPIDTDRYQPGARTPGPDVVLGWIGSHSTTRYLEMIREPLSELARRKPGLRLRLIGAGPFEIPGMTLEVRDWSLKTELEDLRGIDIGLMPLPDDPWTRGKGGYKLLQYLSMGIPAVASPVGVNREIVTDGVHGFWASNSAEWVGCLERLVEDASLRRALGGAGRRKVEACYSLERSNRHLLQILESVAGGQG